MHAHQAPPGPADREAPRHSAAGRHRGRLRATLALVAGFFVVELVTGLLTGSLALLSDAGHMLTDVAGLLMAVAAVDLAARGRPRLDRSYGLYRLEILAAGANAVLLLGLAGFVLVEAVRRFAAPTDVVAGPMLVVAVLGLGVNAVSYLLLHRGASESITLRAASLEVLADGLASLGAIVAAIILLTTGWPYADPLVAAAVAVFIVPRALRLGRDAARVLLQAAPKHLSPAQVRADLIAIEDVVDVHDLHLWTLTSGMEVATAHLMIRDGADSHAVLDSAQAVLVDRHGVDHATLQVEPESHDGCEEISW